MLLSYRFLTFGPVDFIAIFSMEIYGNLVIGRSHCYFDERNDSLMCYESFPFSFFYHFY